MSEPPRRWSVHEYPDDYADLAGRPTKKEKRERYDVINVSSAEGKLRLLSADGFRPPPKVDSEAIPDRRRRIEFVIKFLLY